MIRNWCCSFIMCSYETVFWLPLFLSCAMALKLTSKRLERFPLPLVYLWDCILQHSGSGKKRTSSSWSMQPLRPLNSTDPETIPFDQRLGRRIFPPVNLEQSNLRLFKFLASLGLQYLGQCGTASSVVPKESPCTIFLQQPCRTFHTNRLSYHASASSRGTTASSASCGPLHSCITSYNYCFGQHFITVTDHVLCASVQTLCCVPLCTAT